MTLVMQRNYDELTRQRRTPVHTNIDTYTGLTEIINEKFRHTIMKQSCDFSISGDSKSSSSME